MPKLLPLSRTLAAGLALLVLTSAPGTAQDFENAKIETTDLGNGLHMMVGVGGNLVVSVGEDGTFLIDDQFAPMAEKITAAIADITDQPVSYLINTHWHGDHTGGNENFGDAGAIILAHDNVRKRMSTEQVNKVFGSTTPPSPDGALPVITFSSDVTVHFNGMAIQATHVPHAHTDGDAIIQFKDADVIHTGDTFFHQAYPFIDVGSGGTIDGVLAALAKVLEMSGEDTKIVPGHGPLATKADLQAAHDMLKQLYDAIKPLVDQGMTAEEIVAAKPLADIDTGWTGGFLSQEQFITIVSGAFAGTTAPDHP